MLMHVRRRSWKYCETNNIDGKVLEMPSRMSGAAQRGRLFRVYLRSRHRLPLFPFVLLVISLYAVSIRYLVHPSISALQKEPRKISIHNKTHEYRLPRNDI